MFLSFPPEKEIMSSPIALRQFDEDEYRNRVRTLSDEDLVKEGKMLRSLVGNVVSAGPPCVFDIELRICREEYRRRHPLPKN
jgi:hypothetical protein